MRSINGIQNKCRALHSSGRKLLPLQPNTPHGFVAMYRNGAKYKFGFQVSTVEGWALDRNKQTGDIPRFTEEEAEKILAGVALIREVLDRNNWNRNTALISKQIEGL